MTVLLFLDEHTYCRHSVLLFAITIMHAHVEEKHPEGGQLG